MDLPGNTLIRDFMDKLTATTNVSKYVELPMIAVMGDTSSGKSSLLSSISLVELPSHSKLTTRCPIVLRMCKSDKKHATVAVQWKQKPVHPENGSTDFPEEAITEDDWKSLPLMIEKAQQHIINCTSKEVARDCVNVHVFAPDCHDLTLIDLPGIVRSRGEDEGATIVEDINGLIEDYLGNSRCVILAVVPANVDFHNSQIMASAKEVDPDTHRTIPVITKPDLIDAGGENDVLELLRGEKIKFDLGFHMVKGRGQADLDKKTTIEAGLLAESSFFDNVQPWRDVEGRDMFGTANLRSKLGELQMKMIRDTIPDILKDMSEKKLFAEKELVDMGQILGTPSDRALYFRNQIHHFLSDLKASLSGSLYFGSGIPASAKLHKAAGSFQEAIAKGRLANITVFSKGDTVIETTSMGDEKHTIARIRESDNTVQLVVEKSGEEPGEENWYLSSDFRRDPKWLMEILADRRTQTLPCFLNEEVFRSICSEFMEQDWRPHCDKLLEEAFAISNESIDLCLDSSNIGRRYQSLRLLVQNRAKLEVQKLYEREKSRLKNYLFDEMDPYTQNHYLFENLSKKRSERLKKELCIALGNAPVLAAPGATVEEVQANTMKQSNTIVEAVFDRNQKKSIDEHVAEEMEAVLDAYGKVAMKRFIDLVPMSCRRIFRGSPDAIRQAFDGIGDNELQSVLRDDRAFRQRHIEMELQVSEMEKGLTLFSSVL